MGVSRKNINKSNEARRALIIIEESIFRRVMFLKGGLEIRWGSGGGDALSCSDSVEPLRINVPENRTLDWPP